MLKALIKKQLLEIKSFYLTSRKSKKLKVGKAAKGMLILLAVCYVVLLGFFGFISYEIGQVTVAKGETWLYFLIVATMAAVLGLIGSIFTTYSSLYKAKDNEQLLSFPFTPSQILFARMLGVFIYELIYEVVVFIPGMVVCWILKTPTVWSIVSQFITLFVVGLFVMVLSCILGWVVARISSYIHNKTVGAVIITLLMLGLYYFLYFRFNDIIKNIASNIATIGPQVKKSFYPAYALGMGAAGDPLSLLIVTAGICAIFAIMYLILAKSFVSIVTKKTGLRKKAYRSETIKVGSVNKALFNRELKHLLNSATYIINFGFALILIVILAIASIIYCGILRELTGYVVDTWCILPKDAIAVFLTAVVCLILGFATFSAPSVSLEGKNIWIVQSMPVSARDILSAKERMHFVVCFIPAAVCSLVMGIVLELSIPELIVMILEIIAFIGFVDSIGLELNLRKPNLDWINETIPVKQSLCVFFTMLIGLGAAAVSGGLYYFLRNVLGSVPYMLILTVIFAGAAFLTDRWNKTKGAEIFSKLS